jgi:hypothetical protein
VMNASRVHFSDGTSRACARRTIPRRDTSG